MQLGERYSDCILPLFNVCPHN